MRTFLEDRSSVYTHDSRIGIFVFLAVTHDARGELPSFMNCRIRRRLRIESGVSFGKSRRCPVGAEL